MTDQHFPILGASCPPLIGRGKALQRIWSDLTKMTPSHLSVVGPRYSGKTVLLKAVAARMRQGDSGYDWVIEWDLGHLTPDSDASFLANLQQLIANGLALGGSQYAEYVQAATSFADLREVLETFEADEKKLLVLWDGFDKPLGAGRLSRNLWDQLRELAASPALRVVTATRRSLHELIRNEESVTSDFWNIFDPAPVRIGIFDDDDCSAALAGLAPIVIERSGRTELANWSAAYPPLYLAILNEAVAANPTSIDNEAINHAAELALEREHVRHILSDMWDDCSAQAQDLYRHLVRERGILIGEVGASERTLLQERGFATSSGNRVILGCRLLARYLDSARPDGGSLARLFASWDDYRKHIRGVMELRLAQLYAVDGRLKHLIERAIQDIPDHPDDCLANMRGIADRALDMVWDRELGKPARVPKEWFEEWKYNGERGPENDWNGQFPSRRGHQIRLLQLMTGTERTAAKARHVSKSTFVLLSTVQRLGDFGQHLEGVSVDPGTAVAALMSCVELSACLARELVGRGTA